MNLTKKRILIIDDNTDIHEDFRKILTVKKEDVEFEKAKSMLFSTTEKSQKAATTTLLPSFEIDSAHQGEVGLDLVKKAIASNQPYALAFIDIRMPPGWDGIETAKNIWQVDPEIQIVICTAYSDYSWKNIASQLQLTDNFLILKKPFDTIEITQLASALTKKWEFKRCVMQQVETLEAAVEKRTADLLKAKKMAEKANRTKGEFLRNMSHELLNPLNGIIGFGQLMSKEQIGLEERIGYANDILLAANHLTQMISDILYMSTFDTDEYDSQLKLEQLDLPALVNSAKENHIAKIKDKQLQFEIKIDPTLTNISNDPSQIQRILYHLISNAVKFTPKNGNIKVNVFPVANEQFRLEIIDSGIGINKDDAKKVFATFQQLDSSMSKKYEGIGIGLALVRYVVESQGGQAGVESEVDQGSTFFVILPIHPKSGAK